jgi:MFS family permease
MTSQNLRTLLARDRATFAVVAALFVMVTVNQLGTGILSAVIPVRLAADGHSASAAGAISTVFSAFFLVGCLVGPRAVARLGASRTLLAVGVINAGLALLHWAFPGPVAWAVLRGIAGLSTATYFVLVESWVASQTTPDTRGLVFGVYMVLIRMAFAIGQLIIAFVAPETLTTLFLAASVLYIVSPLLRPRVTASAPPAPRLSLSNYLELPRHAPAAAVAAFMHGVLFATIPGLLPKWGIDVGVSVGVIATTLAIVQVGGLVLQLPLSFVSDKIERRTIMALATIGSAAVSLAIIGLPPVATWYWLLLMLLWGGFASSLYSLGLAHASDIAPAEQRLAWVSSQMLIWGMGAMLGPMIAALCMDAFGAHVLWYYSSLASLAAAFFFLWRKKVRPR